MHPYKRSSPREEHNIQRSNKTPTLRLIRNCSHLGFYFKLGTFIEHILIFIFSRETKTSLKNKCSHFILLFIRKITITSSSQEYPRSIYELLYATELIKVFKCSDEPRKNIIIKKNSRFRYITANDKL